MIWIEYKHYLSTLTGLSQDALHIYAALLIQFGAAWLLKRTLSSALPLLLVLLAVLLNEAGDLYLPGNPLESWQISGSIKDLWNTILAPSLLFTMARISPQVFQVPAARVPSKPQ